jgi:hypothetical protein
VFSLTFGALGVSALAGCGKPPSANLTERLWVSDLPTNPKETISMFVISDVKNRQLGLFYRGSMYRGVHDLFRWNGDAGGHKGKMRLLQDGKVHAIRTETCEPGRGFDFCILVHGDPTGVVRYQSRKRWALRKKGASNLDANEVFRIVAEEDEDLQALTEAALDPESTLDEG